MCYHGAHRSNTTPGTRTTSSCTSTCQTKPNSSVAFIAWVVGIERSGYYAERGIIRIQLESTFSAFFSLRLIFGTLHVLSPLGCTCTWNKLDHSASATKETNRRSFSIKSTCVMIIRRQQYRLQPSWSIASLDLLAYRVQTMTMTGRQ